MPGELKAWARRLKRDVIALWLAARDARTPAAAKVLAGVVAAYALSPIDLIPDFIPVLGLLDDLLIVPLGIWAAVKLVPADVLLDCREAAKRLVDKPVSRAAAAAIIGVWLAGLALAAAYLTA